MYKATRSEIYIYIIYDIYVHVCIYVYCEKVASNLPQVGGFLRVLRFPPPLKLACLYMILKGRLDIKQQTNTTK